MPIHTITALISKPLLAAIPVFTGAIGLVDGVVVDVVGATVVVLLTFPLPTTTAVILTSPAFEHRPFALLISALTDAELVLIINVSYHHRQRQQSP